jgi:hypothetical protein
MANVEYLGGPADGRRDTITVAAAGIPPTWLAYLTAGTAATVDTRFPSAAVHRYEREPGYAPGRPWRYHHRGTFP